MLVVLNELYKSDSSLQLLFITRFEFVKLVERQIFKSLKAFLFFIRSKSVRFNLKYTALAVLWIKLESVQVLSTY